MKIQIALVSKETLPVFYMINEFLPDVVYLVGTAQTAEEMDNIEKAAQKINVRCEKRVTKPDDMKDSYNVCEGIVTENGTDNEYCFNLTCGTKLMAFSALVCAQAHKAKVVYSDTAFYTDFDTMERKPITRMLDIDTIIALQGQKVKEKVVYQYDPARTECAKAVKDFVSYHVSAYAKLAKYYQKNGSIPKSFSTGAISYSCQKGRVVIKENDIVIFSSDNYDAFKMLFSGRWWEDLVADAVHEWAGEGSEVWTSVRFGQYRQHSAVFGMQVWCFQPRQYIQVGERVQDLRKLQVQGRDSLVPSRCDNPGFAGKGKRGTGGADCSCEQKDRQDKLDGQTEPYT